ncbi:MAG: outer membrane lipid asymmetry maintenance protein MlaD [Gammaproteobacteria bacterium]|jgi:phospholipid/cholesterol/gamma-HCH transport system substrate-binding protein|nr:outer membrane lipid asymmetry maintenance protein MlaD [Gammaproteobacteria bacterium]
MKKLNAHGIEILVGAFVAAGFVAMFFLAMKVSNLGAVTVGDGYQVTARFRNVGGLKVRAPVSMGGVPLGKVVGIHFDDKTFDAVVTMEIDRKHAQIPDDTYAKIYTAGLLGEQYVGLEPGGSDKNLKQGSEIRMTQSALVLEEVIGQFIFSKAQEGSKP